jgi:hypothetical protein
MKKITRTLLSIVVLFSSCTKEPSFMRNYSQPIDINDPCGYQLGGNVSWYEGMSDEECINKIKSFDGYDSNKPIFLSPTVYDLSEVEENKSVNSPNPKYMLFPHVISSMSDEWNWDYLKEMKSLKKNHGDKGIQMFLDKYLQGDSTLGMKLEPLNWN